MRMVVGHGVDLVELADFERLLHRFGGETDARSFTEGELAYAGQGDARTARLATRFAAKEAVLKALGTGWVTGLSWKDIEIVSAQNGAPAVVLSGGVERLAHSRGVTEILVSLTHTSSYAIASVIALGGSKEP